MYSQHGGSRHCTGPHGACIRHLNKKGRAVPGRLYSTKRVGVNPGSHRKV